MHLQPRCLSWTQACPDAHVPNSHLVPDRHHKPNRYRTNSDHPPETCSTSLPSLSNNKFSICGKSLTTLFPSHNPLGNNINFISKICLDSHCFSLSPLLPCWSRPSSFLIVCYFSRFWMNSACFSILPLYSPLSKSSQHFLSSYLFTSFIFSITSLPNIICFIYTCLVSVFHIAM